MRSSCWRSSTKYQPPSSTTANLTAFLDELSDLLSYVGQDIVADRFIGWGDVNCPGDNQDVDPDLLSFLDMHGLRQFVTTPTRRTLTGSSLLDVVFANRTTRRLQQVSRSVQSRPRHVAVLGQKSPTTSTAYIPLL